jgi:hypothetical protein
MAVWAIPKLDAARAERLAEQHLPRESDRDVRAEWAAISSLPAPAH